MSGFIDAQIAVQEWMVNKLFVCEKNHSCCDYMYWDRLDDVDKEAKECGHLLEVAEVRHGRWIAVDGDSPCDEWDCTACGQRRTYMCEMDADDMKEFYPYCPNCGAKMDLEVQDG